MSLGFGSFLRVGVQLLLQADEARRRIVLQMMHDEGLISLKEQLNADAQKLPKPKDIHLPVTAGRQGYFAEYVEQQLVPYYVRAGRS